MIACRAIRAAPLRRLRWLPLLRYDIFYYAISRHALSLFRHVAASGIRRGRTNRMVENRMTSRHVTIISPPPPSVSRRLHTRLLRCFVGATYLRHISAIERRLCRRVAMP